MFIAIFIGYFRCRCIVWWIDINTLYIFFILPLQQSQRLKILGVNQQAIALFIDMIDRSKQRIFEFCRKEFRVEHKEGILLEKFHRQRHGISTLA